jgi:hypothetical protein
MLHATGILEAADSIGLRPTRGFGDRDHVTATALLNLVGLGSCDDLKYLRDDAVLGSLCRETGRHHGVKPRTDNAFPSPSAYRSWLHDVGGSPAALAVVKGLLNKPVDYIQKRKPQREVTLDMDATFIPTKQGDAPVNYQGVGVIPWGFWSGAWKTFLREWKPYRSVWTVQDTTWTFSGTAAKGEAPGE